MGAYLRVLSASPPLSRDDELQLAIRIQDSDRALAEVWLESPVAYDALADLARQFLEGDLAVDELLLNADRDDPGKAWEQAAIVCRRILSAGRPDARREMAEETMAQIATEIGALRLHPAMGHKIDGALAAAVEAATDPRLEDEIDAVRAKIVRIRRNATELKSIFLRGSLRLVVYLARRYRRPGVTLLDLIQEGNISLMRAIDKFDHRRGVRFTTYAGFWVKQALDRAAAEQLTPLRLPMHLVEGRRRILRLQREAARGGDGPPLTTGALALSTGMSEAKIETVLSMAWQQVSMDAEGTGSRLRDRAMANDESPDDEVARKDLVRDAQALLGALEPRERAIVTMRYGLDGGVESTLEEIGRALGITRERVRQLESRLLEKLRLRSKQQGLEEHLK